MKKMFALLLVLVLALTCLSACGASSDSDLKYIQKKGTMIVGITDYEPMDYKDENGNWTGFDAELANKSARSWASSASSWSWVTGARSSTNWKPRTLTPSGTA